MGRGIQNTRMNTSYTHMMHIHWAIGAQLWLQQEKYDCIANFPKSKANRTKNHWQKKIEKKEGLQTLVSLGIPKYVPGSQDGF